MRIHPGFSLLTAVVTAGLLERFVPASLDVPLRYRLVAGGIAFAAGAVAIFLGLRALQSAGTAVEPHRNASSLVTSGPFRYSRNPMYAGNLLLLLGFVGLTASAWFIAAALAQFALLDLLVIPREEASLRRSFPDEAEKWISRTRRWF